MMSLGFTYLKLREVRKEALWGVAVSSHHPESPQPGLHPPANQFHHLQQHLSREQRHLAENLRL
jgi:hypothetical protein